MKTRKRLSHNALLAELFPMLRFAAKVCVHVEAGKGGRGV